MQISLGEYLVVIGAELQSSRELHLFIPISDETVQLKVVTVHTPLASDSYKPLEHSSLQPLSVKTTVLLALTALLAQPLLFVSRD